MLADYLRLNKVDILLIQEHNIRYDSSLDLNIFNNFTVYLNLAVAHKGGTGILINKNLDVKLKRCENFADARLMSMHIELYGKHIQFINLYAPSGSNNSMRDDFFY